MIYFTQSELAKILKISPQAINKKVENGDYDTKEINGKLLIGIEIPDEKLQGLVKPLDKQIADTLNEYQQGFNVIVSRIKEQYELALKAKESEVDILKDSLVRERELNDKLMSNKGFFKRLFGGN